MSKRKTAEAKQPIPLIPAGRVCGACLFYCPDKAVKGRTMVDGEGRCHCYPPELMLDSDDVVLFSTPPVAADRLACSMFAPKVN